MADKLLVRHETAGELHNPGFIEFVLRDDGQKMTIRVRSSPPGHTDTPREGTTVSIDLNMMEYFNIKKFI